MKVKTYAPAYLDCSAKGLKILALRTFDLDGQKSMLIVELSSLKTKIVSEKSLDCRPTTTAFIEGTNYQNIRAEALRNKVPLKNAGLIREPSQKVFLTVDLCPSSHLFDRDFFEFVHHKKIPIGISVSGNWIENHPAELEYIKNLGVPTVWINHTLSHPYEHGVAYKQNFLLKENVNLQKEIIGNEILMIENGLTPSIFVRFPGLISNSQIVEQMLNWGLVPIGAEAWLALGQMPKAGSIILVHGNGNEKRGLDIFFDLITQLFHFGFGELT